MEDYLAIKKQFILNPDVAYLNHGSFGACPQPVFDDYQKWQRLLERDPYQFMLKTGVSHLEESKKTLADYIHCDQDDIVYVQSPTMAMNIVIKNLDLKPGDEVLSTNHEYGALERAWTYYCKKVNAHFVQQNIALPINTKEDFLKQFWSGLTPNTKVVFLSQITSPTSIIFPVHEICEKAKELGLITIIDGAHAPGQIDIDLRELKADVYTGACHKWMLTPKGNSFLYVKKEFQDRMDPLVVSWGYESDNPSGSTFQDYHQHNGTRDFSAYLTTPAALEFMHENKWEERKEECRRVRQHYYPIVAGKLNSNLIAPNTDEFLGQMCSIPIQLSNPTKLKEMLFEKYNIEIPILFMKEAMFLRISFQAYNGEAEIEQLLDAIKKIKSTTSLLGTN